MLREREGGGVGADRADVLAAPCGALVPADVVLCDLVQCGRELHADDLAERIVGGNEQDAALAGAEVDEAEAAEILPDVEEQRVDEQARRWHVAEPERAVLAVDGQLAQRDVSLAADAEPGLAAAVGRRHPAAPDGQRADAAGVPHPPLPDEPGERSQVAQRSEQGPHSTRSSQTSRQ